MKPYIGILIDSFWEALSSKVLWALLAASTVILVALAPFGLTVERSFKFANFEINAAEKQRLFEKLARGLDDQGPKAVQTIARRLDEKLQQRIRQRVDDPKSGDIGTRELVNELNRLLTDRNLYVAEAFTSTAQIDRYKPMIEQLPNEISDAELEELNRRLLYSAFSSELNNSRGEQIWLSYAGFQITGVIPLSRKQIRQFFEPLVLAFLMKVGLGILVVFIAIIMTSWIIPDTFRSGALHLMLSKPISRTWLFLSKFFGGCIFISLNLIYVIIGLYLIAGLRFEIWNNGMLACIPLLLFGFVILYSVSALAGLIWGNAIVCIVACMIFWGLCFALGVAYEAMSEPVERNQQISRIAEIKDYLLTVNEVGQLSVWNPTHTIWQPATDMRIGFGGTALTFGPIYDSLGNQIIAKSFRQQGPFDPLGNSDSRSLSLIQLEEPAEESQSQKSLNSSVDLAKLRTSGYWPAENGPDIPAQVSNILSVDDLVIAVCRSGLYLLDLSQFDSANKNRLAGAVNQLQKWFGTKITTGEKDGPFRLVSSDEFVVTNNTFTSATRTGKGLIAHTSGKITLLKWNEDKFTPIAAVNLEGEGTEPAIVAADDTFCVVARADSPILVFDQQLQPLGEIPLARGDSPKSWSWIPGTQHQLSLVTHAGNVLRVDCQQLTTERIPFKNSGRITAIHWRNASQVYLGIQPNMVELVDLEQRQTLQQFSPQMQRYEKVYNWLVKPLYQLNPKPGALDDTMLYLLTGKANVEERLIAVKLDNAKIKLNIWQPILSNLAFVVVMLTISCIYVSRKEF
jgi:ABC-type transport system involved in multi-copper enzyme maturation permease subunit